MRYLILGLLILGCGPVKEFKPHCITSLGLRYMGQWETGYPFRDWEYSCEYFENTQNKLIASIGTTYNKSINLDSTRFKDVEIWLMPKYSWLDPMGRKKPDGTPLYVSGITFCELGYIQINNDYYARNSSLPHELFHIMQGCNSPLPIDEGVDIDHSDWIRDGIIAAIEKTQAL